MHKNIYNILIVGIGGQGVNSLSTIFQNILLNNGQYCKGSIFKGGAQKRGTIFSTIRIFKDEVQGKHLSSSIPHKELDVLLALEATESLRYANYYNQETNLLINNNHVPFYNERFNKSNPVIEIEPRLKENFNKVILKDLNALSIQIFNSDKMVNLLIGMEAIKLKLLPIDMMEFIELFEKKVAIEYSQMMRLLQFYEIEY